jgi:hypothetical protein
VSVNAAIEVRSPVHGVPENIVDRYVSTEAGRTASRARQRGQSIMNDKTPLEKIAEFRSLFIHVENWRELVDL